MCSLLHETWRGVLGYEDIYQVSNMGNVRRLLNDGAVRILHPTQIEDKHMIVSLCRHNKSMSRYVHQLVLEAFVGKRPFPKYETRHLDGNSHNNKLNNLKWGTRSENRQDAIKHGTSFQPDNRGSKNGASKLTEVMVINIKQFINQGIPHLEIAKRFNVRKETISRIRTGRAWKHV